MSFYDVVMLVVLGGAIWFGFWKGLAWQIASVAAVCVSYIVAVNFREPVSQFIQADEPWNCLLYTSPSPRDQRGSRMPSSA